MNSRKKNTSRSIGKSAVSNDTFFLRGLHFEQKMTKTTLSVYQSVKRRFCRFYRAIMFHSISFLHLGHLGLRQKFGINNNCKNTFSKMLRTSEKLPIKLLGILTTFEKELLIVFDARNMSLHGLRVESEGILQARETQTIANSSKFTIFKSIENFPIK